MEAEDFKRAAELQSQIAAAREACESASMLGKNTAPNIDVLESLLQEAVKLQDFGRASELQSRLIDAREARERHLRPTPAAGS